MGKLERRVMWGVVLGVLVYACLALVGDARQLGAHLASFPLGVMAAALGLSLVNYGLRFIKWQVFLGRLGFGLGVWESFNIFVAGMVMSVTPGKVGEVLKSLLLKERHGFPVAHTAPVVFAERVTDLLGLFVIAAAGITVFDYGRVAFGVSLALVIGLIVVLNRPALVAGLLDGLERLPWVDRFRDKLDEAYEATRKLLGWKLLSWTTVLSVLGWSMEALAFFLILDALGAEQATVGLAAFVFSMTTILGAVSFLPGGLGVTEASMVGALVLLGVSQVESIAVAATYLIRFSTLWFGVLLGGIALVWLRLDRSDSTQHR